MKKLLIAFLLVAGAINAQNLPSSISNYPTTGGAFTLSSIISPTSLAADQNNYAPVDATSSAPLSSSGTVRLTSSVTVNITGLSATGIPNGAVKMIHNIGTNNIVLKNNSVSSSAANRFQIGADVTLGANAVVELQYDSTSTCWRALSGGGGGAGTVTTFSAGNLSPLFTSSVATATTTPALTFSLSTAGAHAFLGNNTGSTAAPAYVQPADADLSLTDVTTNNVVSTKHGFAPKSPADATKFLNGAATPAFASVAFSNLSGTATTAQLPVTSDFAFTAAQSITLTDATTNAVTDVLNLSHNSSGTPANGLGTGITFKIQDSTTADTEAAEISSAWSTVTHATHASYIDFEASTAGAAVASVARMFGSGGFSVNSTTDPGAGIINANTGFRIGNAATTAHVLRGNGTNYVDAALNFSDLSGSATTGQLPTSSDFAFTGAQSITLTNATNNNVSTVLTLSHDTSGTPAIGLGTTLKWAGQDSTTADTELGEEDMVFTTVTHATRTSSYYINILNSGALETDFRIFGGGGANFAGVSNPATDPGLGYINTGVGYKINGTALAVSNLTGAPTGAVVGTTDTQTLTNKRVNPRVDSSTAANSATWAPNSDTTDIFELAGALSVAVTTISNPSGTPVEGQKLMIRIKSDSSTHALTWSGTQWRASGATGAPALPSTTTASKNMVIGFMWNSTDTKWDLLAVQDGY